MNSNEQLDFLNKNIPDYTDILNMVFRQKYYVNTYSNSSDDPVFPITRALLYTYAKYMNIGTEIIHTKWGFTHITDLLQKHDSFDKIIKNELNMANDANRLYILQITRGYDIFELAKKYEGYISNASLALQLDQTHKIAVVKMHEKCTVILTNKYNVEEVQSFFSIIPIVFAKENMPKELINAFLALSEYDYETIVKTLATLYKDIDISELRKNILREMFKNSFSSERQIRNVQTTIDSRKSTLRDYYNSITDYIKQIKELELKMLMLKGIDTSKMVEEIIQYLTTNKYISSISKADSNTLRIVIESPIYFFDEKQLEIILKTKQSYADTINARTDNKIIDFLKEAFLEKKYKVWTKTIMNVRTNYLNDMLSGQQRHNVYDILNVQHSSINPVDVYPQPHLTYHSCFGGNEIHIHKALEVSDLIGFFAQTIASCQNINFGDSTVGTEFLKDIASNYTEQKAIEVVETGKRISYKEWKELQK